MDWFKHKLQGWLFPQELLSLNQAVQEQLRLHSLLQSFKDLADEKPRLTLADLQLTHAESLVLKSCDKEFRHALHKSCEHICLTAYPECCRKTALTLQDYLRKITMSDKNKMPIDETPLERANERSKRFFTPRI